MDASMTGEEIQALAYALPPLPPQGLAAAIEIVSITMGVISVVLVTLRIFVRAGFSRASQAVWGFEDFLAVLSVLTLIPAVVFAVFASRYGMGHHDADMSTQLYLVRAVEYQLYWEALYLSSTTIIKCAIGLTCIRLDQRKRVVVTIAVNMSVVVIVTILALIWALINCIPIAATWNPKLGTCQQKISLTTVCYIISVSQMATDWASAIVPCFIVSRLQMSVTRKVSIIFILALGITASIVCCVRIPYLKYFDTARYPTETGYNLGIIILLSNIEGSLGIIASSLPPLRKLFRSYYGVTRDGTNKSPDKSANTAYSPGLASPVFSTKGARYVQKEFLLAQATGSLRR